MTINTSTLPSVSYKVWQMAKTHPEKEAIMVVIVDLAAKIHLLPEMPKVDPALNANQPHQSIKSPMTALEGLPMGGSPLMSHLPNLSPMYLAATNAKIITWVQKLGRQLATLILYRKPRPQDGHLHFLQCQPRPIV